VSGPRTLLSRLSSKKINLDLAGVRPGTSAFRINAELLRLPRGVKLLRVSPSVISLDIARIVKRAIPVHVELLGKPPYGYMTGEVEVVPDTVEVSGPAPQVEKIEALTTEVVDLSRVTQSLTQDLELREPEGDLLTYSLDRVRARIEVQEVVILREFRRVKIAVKNATFRAVPTPFLADIAVRGPQRLVEKMRLVDGEVFVDANGQGPGTVTLPVNVFLPPGIEVVSQDPTEVEVKLVAENTTKKPADVPIRKKKKAAGA
jgi:YbbR domain-containing protein